MVDWYLILVPLTLVPVVLLLGFVGCELDSVSDKLFPDAQILKVSYGGDIEPVPQKGFYPVTIRVRLTFDSEGKFEEDIVPIEWVDGTMAAGAVDLVFYETDGALSRVDVELMRQQGNPLTYSEEVPGWLLDNKVVLYCLLYRFHKDLPPLSPDDYNTDDFRLWDCNGGINPDPVNN